MIKLYTCCLVLIIGTVGVGPDIDMKFHQEVMEIVSYDTSNHHQLQHIKVHLFIFHLPYTVNKYTISKMPLISSSLYQYKLTLSHRVLPHCNLLHEHPNHFNSLLLHTSNSSSHYSHLCQAHMLHTSNQVSPNLYNLGLTTRVNLLGNQDHHHSDNVLTLLHSLSFQPQRHNKIQYQVTRSPEFQSQ